MMHFRMQDIILGKWYKDQIFIDDWVNKSKGKTGRSDVAAVSSYLSTLEHIRGQLTNPMNPSLATLPCREHIWPLALCVFSSPACQTH